MNQLIEYYFQSPLGIIKISGNENGISEIKFTNEKIESKSL